MERRLTPASAKAANRAASEDDGLASAVISTSSATGQPARMRSMMAATVSGFIRDGVPPPKNTEVTVRSLVSSAVRSSSER